MPQKSRGADTLLISGFTLTDEMISGRVGVVMEPCIELAMSMMALFESMVGAYFRRSNNTTLETANRNMKQLPLFITTEYRRGACAQSASSKISALNVSATHTRATGG
jgi:hypothetical protein